MTVVPIVGGPPGAACRGGVLRKVDPGTAATDAVTAISTGPRRTVGGCFFVVAVIAILYPLPNVAMHVVETERIGLERSNWRGLAVIPLAAATVTIGVPLADLGAPVI